MATTNEQLKVFLEFNWEPMRLAFVEMFQKLQEAIRKGSPWIRWATEAQRAEAKRVHTAYHIRQKARRRRKR